jgi:hypothetical protein
VPDGAALDTASVGPKTFTVSAMDAADNPGGATHAYAVRYAFSGFGRPIAGDFGENLATAGQSVPVRYSLSDANGTSISSLASVVSLTSSPAACDGSAATGPWQPVAAAGRPSFATARAKGSSSSTGRPTGRGADRAGGSGWS